MNAINRFTVALIFMISLITVSFSLVVHSQSIIDEIGALMHDLQYLQERGVDVSPVVESLNKAIESYGRGDVEEAQRYLHEAKALIHHYEAIAESVYMSILVTRIVMITILVSIPLITYLLLPRIYLYIWFKLHRKWVVRW